MKKNKSQTLKECRISLWHPLKLKLMLHWILIAMIHWEQDGYTRPQHCSSTLYTSMSLHTTKYQHLAFSALMKRFSPFLIPYNLLHSYTWSEQGQDLIGMAVQVTNLIAFLLSDLFISWPGKCFLHVSSFLGNFHSAAISLRSGQFCSRK